LAANYVDPRTGIAFANVFAFREIARVLEHEYVWNGEFGCYVGQEEAGTDGDETQ
jgi:vacuolar protein sorting-associated protein 72